MGCQHLDDFYEMYVLGALVEEEAAVVREHSEKRCPYCVERLQEATQCVYLLLQFASPSRPGTKLKARLLRRLGKNRQPGTLMTALTSSRSCEISRAGGEIMSKGKARK